MTASDAQNQKRELQAKQNKNNSYLSFTHISNYTNNYQSLHPQSNGRARSCSPALERPKNCKTFIRLIEERQRTFVSRKRVRMF